MAGRIEGAQHQLQQPEIMSNKVVLAVDGSPVQRCLALVRAFRDAPGGADIAISAGVTTTGIKALVVKIDGSLYGVTLWEARRVAQLMEQAMGLYPAPDVLANMSDMIMGLRAAADKAEQELPNPT